MTDARYTKEINQRLPAIREYGIQVKSDAAQIEAESAARTAECNDFVVNTKGCA